MPGIASLLISALVVALTTVSASSARALTESPSRDNAALRYWMAMAQLREVPADAARSARLEAVFEGRAGWDETALGPLLDANEPALRTLRRGANLPDCDWGLEWELHSQTPVAHLPKARVLGRLVALAAVRAASRGEAALAGELWRTGVIFATHVGRDGSLVSVLTSRAILAAQLRTALHVVRRAAFPAGAAAPLRASLTALPVGAFAWDTAIDREAVGVSRLMRQVKESRDPAGTYRALTGDGLTTETSVPTDRDMQTYSAFMMELAAAMRLAPAPSAAQMPRLEQAASRLHPRLRELVPVVSRIFKARADLENDRLAVLAALSAR